MYYKYIMYYRSWSDGLSSLNIVDLGWGAKGDISHGCKNTLEPTLVKHIINDTQQALQ